MSEWAQDRVLSLPIYPELTEKQINQIVGEIRNFTSGSKNDIKIKLK